MANRISVEELQALLHGDTATFEPAQGFGLDTLRSRESVTGGGHAQGLFLLHVKPEYGASTSMIQLTAEL
jgi:hypothetical protein